MSDTGDSKQTGRRAGLGGGGERRPGLRAAGLAAARIAAPIVAKRGGGILARLKADWTAVVGAEMAGLCWPEALGRDGALKLRVAPAYALELQHRAPLLIERITTFFGRGVVARIVLVQGTLPLPAVAAARPPLEAGLSAAEKEALDTRLGGISDPQLRAALAGLGQLVATRSRRTE